MPDCPEVQLYFCPFCNPLLFAFNDSGWSHFCSYKCHLLKTWPFFTCFIALETCLEFELKQSQNHMLITLNVQSPQTMNNSSGLLFWDIEVFLLTTDASWKEYYWKEQNFWIVIFLMKNLIFPFLSLEWQLQKSGIYASPYIYSHIPSPGGSFNVRLHIEKKKGLYNN